MGIVMSGVGDGLVENRADLVVVSYRKGLIRVVVGKVANSSVSVKTREDLFGYLDFLKRCVIILPKTKKGVVRYAIHT